MKTKRGLALLLVMIMTLSIAGSFAGCGGNDTATDPTPEVQQEKETGKPEVENPKLEATSTPEPTPEPTPEVMPTVEELLQANEDMFDGKMKMTMSFAYSGTTEYGDVALDMEAEISYYDNIEHQIDKATISMMGVTETSSQETYYVDDEASGMRTEYFYDSETEQWVKSQYAYIDLEEDDTESSPLESMVNAEVTEDGEFYYVTGELSDDNASELSGIMDIDGTSVASAICTLKFERETRKIVAAEVVVKMAVQETEEGTAKADDFVVSVEKLTEPIVIPEEVLATESDGEVDIDWEVTPGDDEEDDDADALPEPDKYAKSEMPEGWGDWYDEYNCKSGTFMMWDEDLGDTIPVTVYANENWYFDNQYTYTLYLAVDDPAINSYSPAYEVEYEDSDVSAAEPEKAPELLLEEDYNETTVLDDVVPIVCNGKQCFYLETTAYEYIRNFVVFQDIGLDNYVEISIMTSDLTTEPLTLIQKFLLNIE